MPHAIRRDPIFGGRRFSVDVTEQCVRWYITYKLIYRDLAAMMAERGVAVTHTTIMRWVLRYVPEYEKRWARLARPIGDSCSSSTDIRETLACLKKRVRHCMSAWRLYEIRPGIHHPKP